MEEATWGKEPQMTRLQAYEKIIELAEAGKPGELTTIVCEAAGIGFETFLKFSQLDKETQVSVIRKLARSIKLHYLTEKYGHCSQ
jgi:hypothetical protein